MRIRSNFQHGDIASPMSDVDTTIAFDEAPNLPTIGGGDHAVIVIEEEIMYLVSYQAGQLTGTVERGKEGTIAVPHSGEIWIHSLVASDLSNTLGFINHGGDSSIERPNTHESYVWLGWVEPLNMEDDDFWEEIPAPE